MTTLTATTKTTTGQLFNGLDPEAVKQMIDSVATDPANGQTRWMVKTAWQGGAVSRTQVTQCQIGGKTIAKDWTINIDEPLELGGTNTSANPQEYLLAATNACMVVTFVALATLHGVRIDMLEIETSGDIDLRGLYGLDPRVNPGYDQLDYTLKVRGDATVEKFRELHDLMKQTSPNFANMARSIAMRSKLRVV